jgi:ATP-dependent Clp protease ATP-binding subunit ClpA
LQGYNFTERVRKVLATAREEAARLHHEYVGTEHILLGLLGESEGVAAAVLQNLNVDLDEIQQKIEETVKKGNAARTTGPDLPYTSRAKKVLELAMGEARELKHSYVGTEHLLLGLLQEEKGIAAQVLTHVGVNFVAARAEIVGLLGLGPTAEGKRPPDQGSVGPRLASSGPRSPSRADLYWLVGMGPFSGRVHSVLAALSGEAARNGREHFTPEDLLLAILRAGGAALAALELLGVDPERLIGMLEPSELAAKGVDSERSGDPQEGPDAAVVRIFAHAATEERRTADGAVGTHHILLGILAEYRGPAYQALVDNGVGYERTRAVVERISG